MEKFDKLTGIAAPMPLVNIDTDMIIPKGFLKTIKRSGLGVNLFDEMRYDREGNENPDFVLNKPQYRDAQILVAGDNFGCGSSREHAPWALLEFGFRAVISSEIADIFRSNALKNRLVPIEIGKEAHDWILSNPGADVEIDIVAGYVEYGEGQRASFPLDRFARHCLLQGVDSMGFLLEHNDAIRRYEDARTCMPV